MIIAVDGPSGSGKSSTARGVATRLGLRYLDTGAMYRAVTWSVLDRGVDVDDAAAVAARARDLVLAISTDPQHAAISADGTDVTQAIRDPRISASVSKIAATNLDVRAELIQRQRAIIADALPTGGVVVEGRDIATVVAPEAELKVVLTADPDARMARRKAELTDGVTAEQLRDQIVRRDADDATVAQFQLASDGAVEVDSTHLSLDEVIEVICRLAKEAEAAVRDRES
jgi:cytidylate kinase